MNKTAIEWVRNPDGTQGYTWNPITGCLNHINGLCKGGNFPCYAYKLAHGRLRGRYITNSILPSHDEPNHEEYHTDPFYPRLWPSKLEELYQVKSWRRGQTTLIQRFEQKPKGIFVCDMSDLFGVGIPEDWTNQVLECIKACPQHRFYLLTKQPQNLPKFSPFPVNCLVGVTLTLKLDDYGKEIGMSSFATLACLKEVRATAKFISFEPLLGQLCIGFRPSWWAEQFKEVSIKWIIIGAQTKPYKPPKIEWVQSIAEAADKADIAVFLKNNLHSLLLPVCRYENNWAWQKMGTVLRQELPK